MHWLLSLPDFPRELRKVLSEETLDEYTELTAMAWDPPSEAFKELKPMICKFVTATSLMLRLTESSPLYFMVLSHWQAHTDILRIMIRE